jgi:hypothetical protein
VRPTREAREGEGVKIGNKRTSEKKCKICKNLKKKEKRKRKKKMFDYEDHGDFEPDTDYVVDEYPREEEERYDVAGNLINEEKDEKKDEDEDEEIDENIDEEDVEDDKKTITDRGLRHKKRYENFVLTKYEEDRMVGAVAELIALEGFKVHPLIFIKAKEEGIEDLDDSIRIARMWLKYRREIPFPLSLRRDFLDKSYEIWYLCELYTQDENDQLFLNNDEIKEKIKKDYEYYTTTLKRPIRVFT